ncbi:uncharacterized protein PHACADRAFT_201344 [Phanerochaete carnosa HHB-10118-sp]|uniref:Uncharacterized protein n=1 Tax=Phanerochaete carnosa (strain HHB-10118-sp) TaxID=650164 RepID=K5VS86_PHACS|nr:uncharacterized protein PHACADRAFT_201344 [Phanerochaete carnosa HHB-10118-sp]EKM49640.1 hypothetical protein PHACADRAFT_201344 [Phanerochaete carnosa HHB-10118-sp]
MDALWYEIHSIVPLLMCLPDDALSPDEGRFPGWKHCITRELTSADWVHFEAHARRVREYVIPIYLDQEARFHDVDLSHPTLSAIVRHFGDRPILSNLYRFENCVGLQSDTKLLLKPPVLIVGLSGRWSRSGDRLAAELGIVHTMETVEELSVIPAISKELCLLAKMPRLRYLSITADGTREELDRMNALPILSIDSSPALRTLEFGSKDLDRAEGIEQFLVTLDTFLVKATPRMPFSQLVVVQLYCEKLPHYQLPENYHGPDEGRRVLDPRPVRHSRPPHFAPKPTKPKLSDARDDLAHGDLVAATGRTSSGDGAHYPSDGHLDHPAPHSGQLSQA